MRMFCARCQTGTEHIKITGLNAAERIIGGAILLWCGMSPQISHAQYECCECGTQRE